MPVPIKTPVSPAYHESSTAHVATDDIWGDAEFDIATQSSQTHIETVSDLPKLRREHYNAGYLEGITISKEQHLQEGFDNGYSSGALVGLEVGQILGLLQGLGLHDLERVAKAELSPDQLFSYKYYHESDELARPKFDESEGHPEIIRWKNRVTVLLEEDSSN